MAEHDNRRDRPRVETTTLDPHDYVSAIKRMSWGAVIAGVVTAIAAQVVFTSLGAAIGLTVAYARDGGGADASRIGMAAGLWWLITGLLSLFAGGWVAGRLSGVIQRRDGGLHGFVTWGTTTLVALYLGTTAAGHLVGGAMSQARSADGRPAITGGPVSEEASNRAAEAAREIQRDPKAAMERATGMGAGAAWWMFFGVLLGAVASAVGGYVGTPTEPPVPKVRATTVTNE